jgi:hypothetical protein
MQPGSQPRLLLSPPAPSVSLLTLLALPARASQHPLAPERCWLCTAPPLQLATCNQACVNAAIDKKQAQVAAECAKALAVATKASKDVSSRALLTLPADPWLLVPPGGSPLKLPCSCRPAALRLCVPSVPCPDARVAAARPSQHVLCGWETLAPTPPPPPLQFDFDDDWDDDDDGWDNDDWDDDNWFDRSSACTPFNGPLCTSSSDTACFRAFMRRLGAQCSAADQACTNTWVPREPGRQLVLVAPAPAWQILLCPAHGTC